MRNLFLLLLLANLGVLAVYGWIVESPDLTPYDGPTITLLRELPAEQRRTSPPASPDFAPELAASGPGAESARCISVGPFAAPDADQATAILRDAGFEPERTVRETDLWDGYWVYIEGIESPDAARSIQAELAENGIDDTLLIANADSGTLISLGVFREIARAGGRAERVGQLGYETVIADNLVTSETYWLDLTVRADAALALDLLQPPGTINRLELTACLD